MRSAAVMIAPLPALVTSVWVVTLVAPPPCGAAVTARGGSDPGQFGGYREKGPGTIARFGGRDLVRGGGVETVEGDERPRRTVLLEFDSADQARTWYHSPEYQEIIGLRLGASTGQAHIVEGVD